MYKRTWQTRTRNCFLSIGNSDVQNLTSALWVDKPNFSVLSLQLYSFLCLSFTVVVSCDLNFLKNDKWKGQNPLVQNRNHQHWVIGDDFFACCHDKSKIVQKEFLLWVQASTCSFYYMSLGKKWDWPSLPKYNFK